MALRVAPLLEARNVTKTFGGGLLDRHHTVALEDFSFAIDAAQPSITAIVGESGSGKTTLARLLLGLVAPTSGQVLYQGRDLHALSGTERRAFRRDVQVIRVPGAWEIPLAARKAAASGHVDAVITLGVLLRGETAHYEAIYNEVSRGIGQSQQETGIPHAFGVLTCENLEQALNRAGIKAGNKGFEAAIAAIEMVSLDRKMQTP